MNRTCTKAKIVIQIPYDRYITPDEQEVMSRYQITKQALPYFIFFHECYHLIDTLNHIQQNKENDLITYQAALKRAAKMSTEYRELSFEKHADEFAYRQYLDLCKTPKVKQSSEKYFDHFREVHNQNIQTG